MYTKDKVTWPMLCRWEPRLKQLYKRAKAVKDNKRKRFFCANRVWYGGRIDGLKSILVTLVGFRADKGDKYPILRTNQAYDLAYRKVYAALPNCRNCSCIAFQDFMNGAL